MQKPVEKICTGAGPHGCHHLPGRPQISRLSFLPYKEMGRRLVDAQYHVSLRKLTDSLAEQALLEGLVEGTKPAVPVECRPLDPLLSAPFRYAPYKNGFRFRRAGYTLGVY